MMDRHGHDECARVAGADTRAIDELQGLLGRQLELVRRDRLADLDELTVRTDALIAQMAGTDVMHSPAFLARRPLLEGLYRELCLTLAAQRQENAGALRAIRRGRKMVRAYRTRSFGR
jgi:hypothetical protein